jgi:hypothetical protein
MNPFLYDYSIAQLRTMTSDELIRHARWNRSDVVRLRAKLELDKREARRPINLRRISPNLI